LLGERRPSLAPNDKLIAWRAGDGYEFEGLVVAVKKDAIDVLMPGKFGVYATSRKQNGVSIREVSRDRERGFRVRFEMLGTEIAFGSCISR